MPAAERISSVRTTPDTATALSNLGLLSELAGTWQGTGFNLIARPDFEGDANLYLQLNQTQETLVVTPIGSSIPNRGFGQDDIELFGLTYLQQISDAATGGAMHIEPGIWVTQPDTTYPQEQAPAGGQIVARMASIPHGTTILAQGSARRFAGDPTLNEGGAEYQFSDFPSFNSTPFPIPALPASPILNAAGSTEAGTAPAPPGFTQYDVTVPASAANPRTPFGTNPPDPDLPASINGVAMQDVVNDPIKLLQSVILTQKAAGSTFAGTVLNVATQQDIVFFKNPNSRPGADTVTAKVSDGGGANSNIEFLKGGTPEEANGPNARTSTVYSTFWIEKVTPATGNPFMQLQYAQMTILEFGILKALPNVVNLGWPHISVATLIRPFL